MLVAENGVFSRMSSEPHYLHVDFQNKRLRFTFGRSMLASAVFRTLTTTFQSLNILMGSEAFAPLPGVQSPRGDSSSRLLGCLSQRAAVMNGGHE